MNVPESLLEESLFTPAQLESLLSYTKVKSHELTLREAAGSRSNRPVSIGSFYRTVQQGRENVRSSLMTVIISLWVGFIKTEEFKRLLEQVGKGLPELELEQAEQLAVVIKALVSRIVI